MKKYLFVALCSCLCLASVAQPSKTNMALRVMVEDFVEPFPAAAKMQMENKLTQLLTRNSIATTDWQNQFVLTAIAVPQTKDIIAGPPTKIAETMDITFYIVDLYNQLIFSSVTMPAKGIAETEAKAYMDAMKHINLGSDKLTQFVSEGKDKIINYYNTQASTIFKKAMALATMKQYEEAMYLLAAIPSESNAYDEATEKGLQVYQMYIDNECQKNLAQARVVWAAEQNAIGATKAGEYLSLILPDAGCYGDAMALYKEIKAKVLDDWKFEMKIYQDQVDLEKQRIEAFRQVGIEYGKHQQPSTNMFGFLH